VVLKRSNEIGVLQFLTKNIEAYLLINHNKQVGPIFTTVAGAFKLINYLPSNSKPKREFLNFIYLGNLHFTGTQ